MKLVDRRFSRSLNEVGKGRIRKVLAIGSLVGRLSAALLHRPKAVVFFTTNRPASAAVDLLLRLVLSLFGVKSVNYIHTMGYSKLAGRGWFWRRLVMALIGKADINVVLGRSLIDDVDEWGRRGSVRVVPNAVDSPSGEELEALTTGRRVVLFFSNLLPEKGAIEFVRMARLVADSGMDVDFVLAGPVPDGNHLRDVLATINDLELTERARLVGSLDETSKFSLLAHADVMVFPSRYQFEAQPLSVIEALSVGTPVVAFDVGGMRDLVPSESGLLVAPGDVAALGRCVTSLLRDPKELSRQGALAFSRYEANHSRPAFAKAWVGIINELS